MKNIFFCSMFVLFAVASCRSDDPDGQQIDQVLNLYIDSAGIDLLNSNNIPYYSTIVLNDEYGLTDSAPVSFSYAYDADSLRYIDYVAGATRVLVDSSDSDNKIYQSKIALQITKKLDDENTASFSDTLILNYRSNASIFQLQNAWYNKSLVFTKTEGQSNVIKVTK